MNPKSKLQTGQRAVYPIARKARPGTDLGLLVTAGLARRLSEEQVGTNDWAALGSLDDLLEIERAGGCIPRLERLCS